MVEGGGGQKGGLGAEVCTGRVRYNERQLQLRCVTRGSPSMGQWLRAQGQAFPLKEARKRRGPAAVGAAGACGSGHGILPPGACQVVSAPCSAAVTQTTCAVCRQCRTSFASSLRCATVRLLPPLRGLGNVRTPSV